MLLCLPLTACRSAIEWAGIRLLYEEAPESAGGVERDLVYRPGSENPKHRLDLFLPEGSEWPTLIFVHGGGWTDGDKSLVVGGADVYGNIGRYYAERGLGVAVINYRLQPEVTWREQVDDIAAALGWLAEEVPSRGGAQGAFFLSGHSAGAQLVARTALDRELLAVHDLRPEAICGVMPVSGAGYDIADEKTYELGAKKPYYEERFRAGDPGDGWLVDASTVPLLEAGAPPFLLLYSLKEWPSLGHQNRLLGSELERAGIDHRVVAIDGESHARMVLALSRSDKEVAREALRFLTETECPRGE